MKNTLKICVFSLFLLWTSIYGQERVLENQLPCDADEPTEEYLATQKYVGNNKYLLGVLRRNGLYLPDDYFDKLDDTGLYKGKELKLEDVRSGKYRSEKDQKDIISSGSRVSGSTIYYIPVKVWVYQNSAGTPAITSAALDQLFFTVQQNFRRNGVPIELYIKCPVSWITSDRYFNIDSNSESDDMWNDYYDSNAMNVHIVNTAPAAGRARTPGNRLYISNNSANTLTHEFGHNFGLQHTHNGRWPCDGDNETCADCWQEPVSRSLGQPAWCGNFDNRKKCEVNGDKLCDTAGEPNQFGLVNSSCQYDFTNGDATDNWGATWKPNTRNYMSYSIHACRTQFTYGQIGCMLDNLPNFASTSISYSISGPTSICPNQAYTYSAPEFAGATNYLWQIPAGWSMTGQGTRTVTITPILNYVEHVIYVSPFCGQKPARLQLNVNNLSLDIFGPDEIPDDGYGRPFQTESGFTNYNWSVWPGFFISSGQGTSAVSIGANPGTQPGYINVSASACDQTIWGSKYVTIGNSGPMLLRAGDNNDVNVYPNPVEDKLTVSFGDQSNDSVIDAQIIDLLTGKIMLPRRRVNKVEDFDMSDLPNGLYILKYSIDGKTNVTKLLKK